MSIKNIAADDLRKMKDSEGLVLRGCGGDPQEWVDGINTMLTRTGILLDGTEFGQIYSFQHNGTECLLFPFGNDVHLNVGKLAMWRLSTHNTFGGTWLSDYVENHLGGFVSERVKPDCALIGDYVNITDGSESEVLDEGQGMTL